MTVDLVISAYKDDLSWVELLCGAANPRVLVYDKWDGGYDREPLIWRGFRVNIYVERPTVARLANVGKNDHTYLHHIVEHYDDLADWTVFTPDGPHDHLHGASMAGALKPGNNLRVPRLWKGRDWGPNGRLNWHLWTSLPDRNGTNWADRYANGTITPAELSFVEWAKQYVGFNPDGPDWPGYQPGGILAVPRRAITYLPRAFYARLRDQLSHAVEPEEGHYMERAWTCVFTGRAKYIEEQAAVCANG